MSYDLEKSFDELLADGADFFSLFGDYASAVDEMTLFGLSDSDLAELL